jgi:hypothetical protein
MCRCACEKDIATGDLNGDNKDDLVIVRIQPLEAEGGVSNLLFLNVNGIMVDSTDLVDGFADLTQDRDVKIVDIDFDPTSSFNAPDVVIASTFGEQPRIYKNLGCCSTACSPSSPCAPVNQVPCDAQGPPTWCGLKYDATENRLPTFSPAPKFCGVAAGDVNNDGCVDLYFSDYDNDLGDRLLFNGKDAQTEACTGFFQDMTETPPTRLCPDYPDDCFYDSGFATGVQIIDIDLDGNNDIVKSDAGDDVVPTKIGTIYILYNKTTEIGFFDVMHDLKDDFNNLGDAYMFAADDMNGSLGVDLYVVRADQAMGFGDIFLVNECIQGDPLPPECDRGDGTVQFR